MKQTNIDCTRYDKLQYSYKRNALQGSSQVSAGTVSILAYFNLVDPSCYIDIDNRGIYIEQLSQ